MGGSLRVVVGLILRTWLWRVLICWQRALEVEATTSIYKIRMGRNMSMYKHLYDTINLVKSGFTVHVVGATEMKPYEDVAKQWGVEIEGEPFVDGEIMQGYVIKQKKI